MQRERVLGLRATPRRGAPRGRHRGAPAGLRRHRQRDAAPDRGGQGGRHAGRDVRRLPRCLRRLPRSRTVLMIPTLTDEHRELVSLVRDVCEREVAPHTAEWDAGHQVPMDALRTLGELGLLGVIIPEEYGGTGFDYTALTLLVEELARYDAGLSVAVAVHAGLCAAPLLRFGSDEQKERYLPRLATGELLGAYALTEPDAGSDTASIRTRATAAGDGFRLDGTKTWITNGGFADFFIVFARTGGPGAEGRLGVPGRAPRRPQLVEGDPEARPSHLVHRRARAGRPRGACRGPARRARRGAEGGARDARRRAHHDRGAGLRDRPARPSIWPSATRRSGRRSAARSRASRACSSRSPTWPRGSRARAC